MKRRDFLLVSGGAVLFGAAATTGVPKLVPYHEPPRTDDSPLTGRRMGMVIDLNACIPDCTACMDVCREENNVAYFGDPALDIHWIRRVDVARDTSEEGHTPQDHDAPVDDEGREVRKVLLLCFHCENPPCAQVCPVQATFQREDGIVIVDQHRCIGCRYCMIACPYSVRFFNFLENPKEWDELNTERPMRSHGVAEGCTMCAHRIDVGRPPACVEVCRDVVGANALHYGDLNDPESDVSQMIAQGGAMRLREDLGTEPKVFFLGL